MWIINVLLLFIFRILPVKVLDLIINSLSPASKKSIKFLCKLNPSLFEIVSKKKLVYVYLKASKKVPAYNQFLLDNGINKPIKSVSGFNKLVPPTSKKNYVEKYTIEERCFNGKFPEVGLLEESAGSSGRSTNWIRSLKEEDCNIPITKIAFKHLYDFENEKPLVILNGFMLGSWSGGHKFAKRIGSMGICKNIGPDRQKIVENLKNLGSGYKFLIGGYPPFLTNLIKYGNSISTFSWKDFEIHILTSGEGFVEEWREYIKSQLRPGSCIYSDYGATDLDIGVSMETPFTIFLRRLLKENKEIRNEILNTDRQPSFIGQFSPIHFYIRNTTNKDGIQEPEISVLNLKAVSPMLKYRVGDEGGIIKLQKLNDILKEYGYSAQKLKNEYDIKSVLPFPLIYIFGRTDGTVSINGAMISPEEINAAIISDSELISGINSFKLSVELDEEHFSRLYVFLEADKNRIITDRFVERCTSTINTELIRSNECFKHAVKKNPDKGSAIVKIYAFRQGIFKNEDSTLKNKYLL